MSKLKSCLNIVGSILFLMSFSTQIQAVTIGNLTHTSGAIVSDSLNDLEWLSFADSRSITSHANLQSLFDDSNSDLYGFSFAGIVEADLFLDAGFGAQANNTAVSNNTYYTGVNATLFTSVMGDGYGENSNNIWRYEVSNTHSTYNWTQDAGSNNTVRSESANLTYDVFDGRMSWLAYRDAAPVSEPSIIALMVFGLAGIGLSRRKQQVKLSD